MKNLTSIELRAINAATSVDIASPQLPAILSLFCGAGGLDLGFSQENFSVKLAIDFAPAAVATHKRNFPESAAVCADLNELQPSGVVALMLRRVSIGSRIGVIGGPPCQGFSRANNQSQRLDPRNKMPTLYIQIVAELQKYYSVEFVVFENVLGIRDKKHAPTYGKIKREIAKLGFSLSEHELCAVDFGVPQNRKRIILTAIVQAKAHKPVVPAHRSGPMTVREVLGSLKPPVFYARGLDPTKFHTHPNHWTMNPKSTRFSTPVDQWSPSRSFKLLEWDAPSPTIAFGHREIHVHPSGTRRLSIYEAMLLQGFPKDFVLEGTLSEQVEQISNAVPPPLARSIASAVICAMPPKATLSARKRST